jgi:KDO2-lipid IV(A) lauroyltransferase
MQLISKEFKSRWLNDLWFGMRRKHGTRFIAPEKSSFEILRALRRNELVVFVLDQFMGPPIGVRTRFFGKETGTAMGCALMADRTHSPVVPCYTYRKEDGRHVMVFEKPIEFLDHGLRDQNIAVMTQIYTDKIEAIVRKHPGQWMWIHRRWKEFRE